MAGGKWNEDAIKAGQHAGLARRKSGVLAGLAASDRSLLSKKNNHL